MLTTVVKFDGTEQPFNPTKLNKWARWGMDNSKVKLDWSSVVRDTLAGITCEKISSQELQLKLIQSLKRKKKDAYELAAGRLYAPYMRKKLFPNGFPTVKQLHDDLIEKGYMVSMGYSDKEYKKIEELIDHKRDYQLRAYQSEHIVSSYSLRNDLAKISFETPQFVYMRLAMFMAHDEKDPDFKMERVRSLYEDYSMNRIAAPSPTFFNAATQHLGLASCCMYSAKDTQPSISASNLITDVMTAMSAGLGTNLMIRSLGDPVRKGKIVHQGKLPYQLAQISLAKSNIQAGRAASQTQFNCCYDPEIEALAMAQNPRTPISRQNRHTNFAIMYNHFFYKKALKKEDVFTFTVYSAPDLYEAFYSGDGEEFARLYKKYEEDPSFKKNWVSAYNIIEMCKRQAHESPNNYSCDIQLMNKQTAFKELIRSLNLCMETSQVHIPYEGPQWLYIEEDHGKGEVSVCSLHGVVINNIHTLEQYEEAAYNAVYVATKCVMLNEYALPHMRLTAQARRNVGIGMLGIATEMAKHKLKWDSEEGYHHLDFIGQRHLYYCVKASLRLAKHIGVAPWSEKMKWKDGWLPFDDRAKAIDSVVAHTDRFNFDALRKEMVEMGGLANSALILMPPTETSSKAAATTPSCLPIMFLDCLKSDGNEELKWVAPHNDDPDYEYHLAYDMSMENLIKAYGVMQKCIDGSISADLYKSRKNVKVLDGAALVKEQMLCSMYGMKAVYYHRIETSSGKTTKSDEHLEMLKAAQQKEETVVSEGGCAGGFCEL